MAMTSNPSPNFWRYRIFALTWLAYAGFYLCRRNFSVVMPLLERDLGYSNFELANIIFGYSLFYSLGQFIFGPFADRFGGRLTVSLGLLLSIGVTVLMGFLPAMAILTVLCCVNGLGQSAGWPGLVKNMASWFRREERGVVMGWWTTNYVLGGFLATVFATFVATRLGPVPAPDGSADSGCRQRFFSWLRSFLRPSIVTAPPTPVYPKSTTPHKKATARPGTAQQGWIYFKMLGDLEVWTIAVGCRAFQNDPLFLLVLAAALHDPEAQVLCQRRRATRPQFTNSSASPVQSWPAIFPISSCKPGGFRWPLLCSGAWL